MCVAGLVVGGLHGWGSEIHFCPISVPKAILLDQDLHKRVAKNLLDPLFHFAAPIQPQNLSSELWAYKQSECLFGAPAPCVAWSVLLVSDTHDCSGSNSNPERVASTSSISVVLDLLQMLPQSWQFSAHHRLGVECRCFRSIVDFVKILFLCITTTAHHQVLQAILRQTFCWCVIAVVQCDGHFFGALINVGLGYMKACSGTPLAPVSVQCSLKIQMSKRFSY